MKILVAGWFSFEFGHATAGDVLARDLVRGWLDGAGVAYDVALCPPFVGGVDVREADPGGYTHVVFVCGPFARSSYELEFLGRFSRCTLLGVDLSMQVPLREWNPFDVLWERDSSEAANPDVTFAGPSPRVPVIGVCLVEDYEGAWVDVANAAIRRLVRSREAAVVEIDTRLDTNSTGLRTATEVEVLLGRMDAVVTTRLHGTVLSLKNGVPVVAIDPQPGGAKVRRQAERIGWPLIFDVDRLNDADLQAALGYCLTEDAKATARACAAGAVERVEEIQREFLDALTRPRRAGRSPAASEAGPGDSAPPADARAAPAAGDASLRSRAKRLGKALARRVTPAPARHWLRQRHGRAWAGGAGQVFAEPRRVVPVSHQWGYDRGLPVDRFYIEAFLGRHAADVQGCVLEVGDDAYTRRFGGSRVTQADVLNPEPGGATTVVGDLGKEAQLPQGRFDCIIFTQTLHLIYDFPAALRNLHGALKPGGVLLATFPGVSPVSLHEWPGSWYWMFTSYSARRMLQEGFPDGDVVVSGAGNVLTCSAFLYGLAAHELRPGELEHRDEAYELIVTVRAVRDGGG